MFGHAESPRIGRMIQLTNNQLRFTFPRIQAELDDRHSGITKWIPGYVRNSKTAERILTQLAKSNVPASVTVDVIRTLRLPNDGKIYHHPPGFGRFPLSSVDEHRVPASWQRRGGVMLPLGDTESLFFDFQGEYPVAIKVTAGGRNIVSGRPWTPGLEWAPQDYLVQTVSAGFVAGFGLCRQFEPLRDVTSLEVLGGFLIEVFPVKRHVAFDGRLKSALPTNLYKRITSPKPSTRTPELPTYFTNTKHEPKARVSQGGLYRQAITPDPRHINDYDFDEAVRCFVQPVDLDAWQTYTNMNPTKPVAFTDFRGDYVIRWVEASDSYRASHYPAQTETCDVSQWDED